MQRFVIEQNIRRFEQMLAAERDSAEQAVIAQLLTDARRELATLHAEEEDKSRRIPLR
jgi:hypothetical protein